MTLADGFTVISTGAGVFFFVAGTAGLLRFPDTHGRLHALTKADSLGLGLIVLSLAPQVGSIMLLMKLVLVWTLAILAAATTSQLIARAALSATLRAPGEDGPAASGGPRGGAGVGAGAANTARSAGRGTGAG